MTISEIKKNASAKLDGKLGKSITVYLVYSIIIILLEYISSFIQQDILRVIYSIVLLIITLPFSYGLIASLIKVSRGEDVQITDFITIGLQNLGKVWGIVGRVLLKLLIPIILYIIAIVFLFYSLIISLNQNNPIFLLLAIVLLIASVIYLIAKSLLYILSTYILYDDGETFTTKEIVEKSADLMTGNRCKYIGLLLSFIGWYLAISIISMILLSISSVIGIIFFFIATILITPYIAFAGICFYEDLNSITTTVKEESIPTEEPKEE